MLSSDRNVAAASSANREHQHARHNKAAHQVPQPGAEVMSASNQITHHQRSDKAAELTDCIDQPDGGSCGRLTQKKRGHGPEARLKAVKRSPHENEQANGYQGPRAVEYSEREGERTQKARDGRLPPVLSSSIGMPAVQLLSDEISDACQSSQRRHL